MNLSKWLLDYDEKFWSKVKDEHKRKDHLSQLYRFRTTSFFVFCICVVMIIAGLFYSEIWFLSLWILAFISQIISYVDADSKIRLIRLYELFIEK